MLFARPQTRNNARIMTSGGKSNTPQGIVFIRALTIVKVGLLSWQQEIVFWPSIWSNTYLFFTSAGLPSIELDRKVNTTEPGRRFPPGGLRMFPANAWTVDVLPRPTRLKPAEVQILQNDQLPDISSLLAKTEILSQKLEHQLSK